MRSKYVESTLGIRCKEKVARYIDNLLKDLPYEQRELKRKSSIAEQVDIIAKERSDVSTITTEVVDRDNEVVVAKGMDRSQYDRNSIVCWQHNYDIPAIGKCSWIKPSGTGLIAKTIYADEGTSELADTVWKLTQQGILKGKSVGFVTLEVRSPLPDDPPAWKTANTVITKSLLLEYSCVLIPANQEALVEIISKSYNSATLKMLGLPELKKLDRTKDIEYLDTLIKALGKVRFNADKIAEAALHNLTLS